MVVFINQFLAFICLQLFVLAMFVNNFSSAGTCPSGSWYYDSSNSICYISSLQLQSFWNAITYCKTLHPEATVPYFYTTQEYNGYITYTSGAGFTETCCYWIGYIYSTTSGTFITIVNTTTAFNAWDLPSEASFTEVGVVAAQNSDNTWYSMDTSNDGPYISACQYRLPIETTTTMTTKLSTTSSANNGTAPYHGGPDGTLAGIVCPNNGAITGIIGQCGLYIDQVSFICSTCTGNTTLGPYGNSTGGSPYSSYCPSGYYVSSIFGRSSSLLDRVGIRCRLWNDMISQGQNNTPIGGGGGTLYDDLSYSIGFRPVKVYIRSTNYLTGIQVTYGNTPVTLSESCTTTSSTTLGVTTTSTTSTMFPTTSSTTTSLITSTSSTTQPVTTSTLFPTTSSSTLGITTKSTTANNLQTTTHVPLLTLLDIDLFKYSEVSSIAPVVLDAVPFILQSLNDSMRESLGYSIEDMLFMCQINEQPCNIKEDFTLNYSPTMGNCFTFNAGLHPRHWTTRAGAVDGLQLLLNAVQSEYPCMATSAGIRVVVHENNVAPFPDAQGSYINPGTKTIHRLQVPYGDCAPTVFENFDSNYSVEACKRACFQKHMVKACSCADPRYPKTLDVSFCTENEKKCLDLTQNCEADMLSDESCNCPPPCNETFYPMVSTAAIMRTKNLMHFYCNDTKDTARCNGTAKNNLAKLVIYFDRLCFVESGEVASYTVSTLLADFSNVVGSMLGVGVISIIEVMYAIIFGCILCIKRKPK